MRSTCVLRPDERHVKTLSASHRSEPAEKVRRDEPAVGSRTIALASEPEEQAVHNNGGEEERLIFKDCVVYR